MGSNSGNPIKVEIEEFEKPSKVMLEVLRLRERLDRTMFLIAGVGGLCGVSVGCTLYVIQLMTGLGAI